MNDELLEIIKSKSNEQLIEDILLGKETYKNGVYDLYFEEASKRGLNINENQIKQLLEHKIIQNIERESSYLVIIGILLTVFWGAFAFIPGLELLSKDKNKEYKFKGKYKKIAIFFCIWSVIFILLLILWITLKINK